MHSPRNTLATDVVQFIRSLHEGAGVQYCCDPKELVEGYGLEPCPWPIERSFVRERTLYFPERKPRDERGIDIIRGFASHLGGNEEELTLEMALPAEVACAISFGELGVVQPNVPLDWLQAAYMRRRRISGFVAAR